MAEEGVEQADEPTHDGDAVVLGELADGFGEAPGAQGIDQDGFEAGVSEALVEVAVVAPSGFEDGAGDAVPQQPVAQELLRQADQAQSRVWQPEGVTVRSVAPAEVVAARGEREQAVVAQPVMIADVLIAEREPEQALGQQAPEGLLAAAWIPMIDKTGGQPPGQADALVDGPQQQGAAIAGHAAAVKAGAHFAVALTGQIDCDTVCCLEAHN